MRRKRGLSGAKGSRMHWAKEGMKVNAKSRGQRLSFPMMRSIPKICEKSTVGKVRTEV